jgi:signal transduction histidine kinase
MLEKKGVKTTSSPPVSLVFASAAIVAFGVWTLVILPAVNRAVFDVPYALEFESRDRLYDPLLAAFGDVAVSKSTFDYKEGPDSTGKIVNVDGEFDVRTLSGERVFNAKHSYVVDTSTSRLVARQDARQEGGYLFAPRFLSKNDFDFWYVSYDAPIRLRYVNEEMIEGVRTYRFDAHFTLDNTANFAWLVGENGDRVMYSVDVSAWFEPVSGHMLKLEDAGAIDLVDRSTGQLVRPWNQYRNVPTEASVAFQSSRARLERSIILSTYGFAVALAILAVLALVAHLRRRKTRASADELVLQPFALDVVAPALVVVALSFFATFMAWQLSVIYLDEQRHVAFNEDSQVFLNDFQRRMEVATNVLRAGAALADASQSVERDEWAAFAGSIGIDRRYRGVLGIGLVRDFDVSQTENFLKTVRDEGAAIGALPPVAGDRRAILTYLEPQSDPDNVKALGQDLMVDPVRRVAAEKARDSGEPTVTAKTVLHRDAAAPERVGLVMLMPFYRHDAPVATVEDRRAAIEGYVLAPIRVADLVDSVIASRKQSVDVTVYDGETTSDEVLYGRSAEMNWRGLRRSDVVVVAGRPWSFVFSEVPGAILASNSSIPEYTVIGGFVVTLLLGLTTVALSTSRRRAVRIARRATAQIADTNRQLQTLFNAIPVGVYWAKAPDGTLILANDKATELLGKGAVSEAKTEEYSQVYGMEREDGKPYPPAELPLVRSLSKGVASTKSDIFVRRPDGQRIALRALSEPIFGTDGKLASAVVVFEDFTRELELDRQKSDFISITSHQLRTPLAAVKWFIEMLVNEDLGPLNEMQKEHVQLVMESNERMITLVNDLLNVSRIESGTIEVTPVETDVRALAKGTADELSPLVGARKQKLKFVAAKDLPRVRIDPKLVRQVFVNLLSNAVKYTPEGGKIALEMTVSGKDLLVTVTDSGIGIPKAQHGRLFTKFFRADNAQASEADGSGLGLYVCKSVVELSGGKIWFTSEEGKGTTFSFSLPLKGSPGKKGTRSLA